MTRAPLLVVVMGVSGSGKTTVGEAVATVLEVPFVDADDLHSSADVARLAAGQPLTDAQRLPWLESTGKRLAEHTATGAVLACSALKRSHRDLLRRAAPTASFVHLDVDQDELTWRLRRRRGHFMPASLLASQLDLLEPPGDDEHAVSVDAAGPPAAVLRRILTALHGLPLPSDPVGPAPRRRPAERVTGDIQRRDGAGRVGLPAALRRVEPAGP